ncbi:MAG: hypothetical protein ACRDJH_17540, partial [Thermomicrobiales bacterium]
IGPGLDRESPGRSKRVPIERLEGPIAALVVATRARTPSRLRYFLDGSQRTLPAYLIGAVPVIASVAAAAILERDERGEGRVMPGMLRLKHTWLVPMRLPEVAPFVEVVERLGMDVADPLAHLTNDDDYFEAAGDYARLIELGHSAANKARSALEDDLLQSWSSAPERATDDGWILVDGTLRVSAPKAVGLVKSFTRQYLTGADAACLFGLPPGHRTTAFRAADGWRPEVAMWFLRFRDAAGRDARHSLVRIEVAPDGAEPARIDELSTWLMAERVPRATADARWATLLYPVHYLERILKRYVDADTRGWPGARAGV